MGTAINYLRIGVVALLLAGAPAYGFWNIVVDVVKGTVEGTAEGGATLAQQVLHYKRQAEELVVIGKQLEESIKHGKTYSGTKAWEAGLEIRKLKDMSLGLTNRGKAIANESYASTGQLHTMLHKAEQLSPSLTAEEQVAFNRAEDVAARKAVRDSLASTMHITSSIYQQLDDVQQRFHSVSEDLSQADSQLEALQLIGASNQQTNTYLHTLTQAIVAQNDLLVNVHARLLAEEDRLRGDGGVELTRTVIVPAHKLDEYKQAGIYVEPLSPKIREIIRQ